MAIERHLDTFLADVDDTKIPWEIAHARAYPAMSQALSQETGIPHQKIIDEIKLINSKHGTIEYTPLIQEMPSFAGLTQAEKDHLIKIAIRSRRDAIKGLNEPFPGVTELLQKLKEKGQTVMAFSDAPKNLAYLRLKRAGFTKDLIDALIALESPSDEHFDPAYRMENKRFDIPIIVSKIKKPDTDLVAVLQKTAEEIRRTCYMMGNSAFSDMGVSKSAGMRFYHTKWDKATPEDRKIIQLYAPEIVLSGNVGTAEDTKRVVHPDFECIPVYHPMEIYDDLVANRLI